MTSINWDALDTAALEQTARSYAPYSNFAVGAAAITESGRIVKGCNVENASYGITLCAECSLVCDLHANANGTKEDATLMAISVVTADGQPCAPCGRCRQLLSEHSNQDTAIKTATGIRPLSELLPEAFGPANL